jgi:hypothetical protein
VSSARRKATTFIQNNITRIYAQTSVPRVRFKSKTSVLERAKTVYALDRATTVIGSEITIKGQILRMVTT